MIGKGLQLLLPPGAGMSHSYSSQPPWLFNGMYGRIHRSKNKDSLDLPTCFPPGALCIHTRVSDPLSLPSTYSHALRYTPLDLQASLRCTTLLSGPVLDDSRIPVASILYAGLWPWAALTTLGECLL